MYNGHPRMHKALRHFLMLIVGTGLAVWVLIIAACGSNPSQSLGAPTVNAAQAGEEYLYQFTAIAGAGNVRGAGGAIVYRVVDTDARVVCYFYSPDSSNWKCLPFTQGAFDGDGQQP
jgi:hypothetical protein